MWKAIEKVMLLGTNRASLPEQVHQRMKAFHLSNEGAEAEVLLRYFTAMYLLRKGAQRLPQLEELPPKIRLDKEQLPSPRLRAILNKMLTEELPQALFIEYLQLSLAFKYILPPESLVYFFSTFKNDLSLVPLVQKLMGNRGHWLLTQNKDWAIFYPLPDEEIWQYGTLEERVELLKMIRLENPAIATKKLEKSWPQLPQEEQLQLLEVLEKEAIAEDIPFLKAQLKLPHQGIRKQAIRILVSIPESKLDKEIYGLLSAILSIGISQNLELNWPVDYDSFRERLVQIGCPTAILKRKDKPNLLQVAKFLISLLPPVFWEQLSQRSPEKAFKLLTEAIFYKSIKEELAESIYLHQDEQWAYLFLKPLLDLPAIHWDLPGIRKLALQLPYSSFHELSIGYIRFYKNLLDESSLIYYILLHSTHPWPDELAKRIISIFQDHLQNSRNYYQDEAQHYGTLINKLAMQIDPALFDQLKGAWPQGTFTWYQWQKRVHKMLRILSFRKELYQAFEA